MTAAEPPRHWLLLHELDDTEVPALARVLRQRLPDGGQLHCLSGPALRAAPSWRLELDQGGTSSRLRLALVDLPDGAIAGVLNRLLEHGSATNAEATYQQQEWRALFAAWLNGLPCPVINRATPQALSGPTGSPLWWRAQAAAVGLPVLPWPDAALFQGHVQLHALAGRCWAAQAVPTAWQQGVAALTRRLDCELLGLRCSQSPDGLLHFDCADSRPSFAEAPTAFIDALCLRLGMVTP